MDLERISAKVQAYLNSPANEDAIAEAIALRIVGDMSPAIMAGTDNPVLAKTRPDEGPTRHGNAPAEDERPQEQPPGPRGQGGTPPGR